MASSLEDGLWRFLGVGSGKLLQIIACESEAVIRAQFFCKSALLKKFLSFIGSGRSRRAEAKPLVLHDVIMLKRIVVRHW